MNSGFRNLKWELILYFLAATIATAFLAFLGWVYIPYTLTMPQLLLEAIGVVVLIGFSVGYFAAHRLQRQLDPLHLGIRQVAKGNLSGRITFVGRNSFADIYRDFNEMTDVLEEKIRHLQLANEEKMRVQANVQEAAVLEERKRLARDLHDTVSQQLFAIHMAASSLPKLQEANPEQSKVLLNQLIQMSHSAQKEMRALIAQLRPLELEGKTLAEALDKWFPDYCRQNGLQGSLDIALSGSLPEVKEQQLFLIIQEGLANVVKHAQANFVTLSLHEYPHRYFLVISDDGIGFDRNQTKQGSYGLTTMRERAMKLGGDMELFSNPGSGTTLKVHIPKF
ncbi:MAG TPA: sensor histidine kinase [Bacilli bacterium]